MELEGPPGREVWVSSFYSRPLWRRSAGSASVCAFGHTTINRMASILNVSFNAAKAGMDQPIEAKVLVERTGYGVQVRASRPALPYEYRFRSG